MEIKIIKTEQEYQETLTKLDEVFDAPKGTTESDYADLLALIIDDYEKKHYTIEAPDPIEAIKIRMEEMHLKQKDISTAIGGNNRASEVLNKKRKLTIEMIRNLTFDLKLSPSLLIKDYQLAK
jgi:HTH-type transcriptional regulator/antitoxin HigA